MRNNRSSSGQVEQLAKCSNLKDLTDLDLSLNNIECDGAKSIATGCWSSLESLNLAGNKIEREGALAIASSNVMKNLTKLDLTKGNIGVDSVNSITMHLQLKTLILHSNLLNDTACEMISNSPTMKNLTVLNLGNNTNITSKGASLIANSSYMQNLTKLVHYKNPIYSEGVKNIAQSPFMCNLTTLDLCYCYVENSGAEYLSTSEYMSKLTRLDLSWNNMDVTGITAIANSPYLTKLKIVNVSRNHCDSFTYERLLQHLVVNNNCHLQLSLF